MRLLLADFTRSSGLHPYLVRNAILAGERQLAHRLRCRPCVAVHEDDVRKRRMFARPAGRAVSCGLGKNASPQTTNAPGVGHPPRRREVCGPGRLAPPGFRGPLLAQENHVDGILP
jgi:hypothetical protein